MGRDAKRRVLAVKVSENELASWRKQAKAAGLTLSIWLLQPRRDEGSK